MVNTHAAAVGFDIGIGGVTEALLISTGLTVPANGRRVFEEWWAIDETVAFAIKNLHATHAITVTIFGAQLAGVAPP